MYMWQCGSSFGGIRLANLPWHITQHLHQSKRGKLSGQILVRAKKEVINATKINHLGEHFLDNLSNYIFHQIKRPFANYIPDNWDPLDFLPVNIQSNLQKSEAIVSPHILPFVLFLLFFFLFSYHHSTYSTQMKFRFRFDDMVEIFCTSPGNLGSSWSTFVWSILPRI